MLVAAPNIARLALAGAITCTLAIKLHGIFCPNTSLLVVAEELPYNYDNGNSLACSSSKVLGQNFPLSLTLSLGYNLSHVRHHYQ